MASCVRWLPQQNPRLVHLKRRLLLVTLHIRLLHILRIDAYSSTRADCGAGSSTARTASGGAVPTAPSTMTLTPGQHFLQGAEVVTGGASGAISVMNSHTTSQARCSVTTPRLRPAYDTNSGPGAEPHPSELAASTSLGDGRREHKTTQRKRDNDAKRR